MVTQNTSYISKKVEEREGEGEGGRGKERRGRGKERRGRGKEREREGERGKEKKWVFSSRRQM